MTYTKKVSKKVFKARILKTYAKLRKIRQCGVAKIHKPRLVRASAFATLAYASQVVVPNGCELRSLRAATAKAIGAGRTCESPYLSLMLTRKDNLDPEFNIVLNALLTLRRLFCKPSYPKQQFLNMVNKPGAAYTNDIICKYSFNISPMCPFCDQLDSRSHRLKCTALTPYCMAHTVSRQTLERMHPIAIDFGLEYVPHGVWQLWEKLQNRKLRITKPRRDPTVFTLFTDGTCTDPKSLLIRLSAAALNIKKGPFISKNIQASLVPGLEQSSARGELYGIILALEKFFASHIYTD